MLGQQNNQIKKKKNSSHFIQKLIQSKSWTEMHTVENVSGLGFGNGFLVIRPKAWSSDPWNK